MDGVGGFGDNLVGRVCEGPSPARHARFACMLGGEDRQTLFMLAADWRIADSPADNMGRPTEGPRTGQVLTAPAPARGDGWP